MPKILAFTNGSHSAPMNSTSNVGAKLAMSRRTGFRLRAGSAHSSNRIRHPGPALCFIFFVLWQEGADNQRVCVGHKHPEKTEAAVVNNAAFRVTVARRQD